MPHFVMKLTRLQSRRTKMVKYISPDNKDAGLYTKEEFIKFRLGNKEKILEAEVKRYICETKKELERKPIFRDQKGKLVGRGSFLQRKPYDNSTTELNLNQYHPDCIRSQELIFIDR